MELVEQALWIEGILPSKQVVCVVLFTPSLIYLFFLNSISLCLKNPPPHSPKVFGSGRKKLPNQSEAEHFDKTPQTASEENNRSFFPGKIQTTLVWVQSPGGDWGG